MQSEAKHLTKTNSNQPVSRSLLTVPLHCDFFVNMTAPWRDPSVVTLPLDDVGGQASGFPPLLVRIAGSLGKIAKSRNKNVFKNIIFILHNNQKEEYLIGREK